MRLGAGIQLGTMLQAGSIWTPPNPPEYWIDPSNPANVTSSGGVLQSIKDLSANNVTVTGNGSPLYGSATINGKLCIQQGGASWIGATLAHSLNDLTLYVVLQLLTGATTGYNAIFTFASFLPAGYYHSGTIDIFQSADHNYTDLTNAVNDIVVLTFKRSGTNWSVYRNGVASSSNPISFGSGALSAQFNLLTEQSASSSSPGKFNIGSVMIQPQADTDANRNIIENRFLAQWGHSP